MTVDLSSKIFNTEATYDRPALILGEDPGMYDTIHKAYPEVWDIYKQTKALDWDEVDFNFTAANVEFKTRPAEVVKLMRNQLAWQWEGDSVASRTIIAVMSSFITSTELLSAWTRISDQENVHAATYSEIVRNGFDNPDLIMREILDIKEALGRLTTIGRFMEEAYRVSHMYALGLLPNDQYVYNAAFKFIVALYFLERVQFTSSFFITFGIGRAGYFQQPVRAVQRIAQDELEIHAYLDEVVLKEEMRTERGKRAMTECGAEILQALNEIMDQEREWNAYQFKDHKDIVDLNERRCNRWLEYVSAPVYEFFGFEVPFEVQKENPESFMAEMLDISKLQMSPQEEKGGQYKLNVINYDHYDIDYSNLFDIQLDSKPKVAAVA